MNLIICTTPFQVLLAEKIIEMYPNEKYILRYFSFSSENKKHLYYFNRLKSKVFDARFFSVSIKISHNNKKYRILYHLCDLYNLFKIKIFSYEFSYGYGKYSKFKGMRIEQIMLASLDNMYIHVYLSNILSRNSCDIKVCTFDDGTANIIKNSFLYTQKNSLKIKLVHFFFLCGHLDLNFFKNKSEKHYSLYKGKSNIIENIEYLNPFLLDKYMGSHKEKSNFCSNSNNEEKNQNNDFYLYGGGNISDNNQSRSNQSKRIKKILINQPIYELDSSGRYSMDYHVNLIRKLIEDLKIDYYFPHPRESLDIRIQEMNGCQVIDTPKIFEDYFLENFEFNTTYVIYNFFSGSIFSVIHLSNVEIVFLKDKLFSIDFSDAIDLLLDYKFSIINI